MPTVASVFAVNPRRIGGVEMFARELSRQLSGCGWNSLLCFTAPPSDTVRRFLAAPNVTIEIYDSCHTGPASLRAFRNMLRAHRPRIVHLHFVNLFTLYPWLARLHGARQIYFTDQYSRSGNAVHRRAPAWKRAISRAINYPLSSVIAVSDYVRKDIVARGFFPADRVLRIYNSVDLSRVAATTSAAASARLRFGIPENRVLVASVCTLNPEKGIDDFLRAAQLVSARAPEIQFALVGAGEREAAYRQLARELGVQDRVTFTGMVQDPFTEGVFAATDIFCLFSRWQEAFGWSVAEAMAHRKPVIATRAGGIPEIVEHGVTGYLVERGAVPEMASRILELAADANRRARMGEAGYRAAQSRFELTANVAHLLQMYGIAGRRGPIGRA